MGTRVISPVHARRHRVVATGVCALLIGAALAACTSTSTTGTSSLGQVDPTGAPTLAPIPTPTVAPTASPTGHGGTAGGHPSAPSVSPSPAGSPGLPGVPAPGPSTPFPIRTVGIISDWSVAVVPADSPFCFWNPQLVRGLPGGSPITQIGARFEAHYVGIFSAGSVPFTLSASDSTITVTDVTPRDLTADWKIGSYAPFTHKHDITLTMKLSPTTVDNNTADNTVQLVIHVPKGYPTNLGETRLPCSKA